MGGHSPQPDFGSGSGSACCNEGTCARLRSYHVIGADEATVDANFASVMEANFASASTEQLLGRLSDKELAAIAKHYQRTRGVAATPLLATLASRLSDQSLLRVAKAFDRNAVSQAVEAYAAPEVRTSYRAQVSSLQPNMLPGPGEGGGGTGGGGGSLGPAPTSDMTLEEIHIDFRTAPVGSLSYGIEHS